MRRVADIRQEFRDRKKLGCVTHGEHGESGDTIEILNAQFVADEPTIFGLVNADYVRRELAWYLSQSLNVNDFEPPVPKIWQRVATEDGRINSNYGYLVFSDENRDQYANCFSALRYHRNTRQAVMIYQRPSMHSDAVVGGMSDFVCTSNVQCFVRQGKLTYSVFMRSNDAVFGYKNDLAWHKWVHDKLVRDLTNDGMPVQHGPIVWHAGSLHVYRRHWGEM